MGLTLGLRRNFIGQYLNIILQFLLFCFFVHCKEIKRCCTQLSVTLLPPWSIVWILFCSTVFCYKSLSGLKTFIKSLLDLVFLGLLCTWFSELLPMKTKLSYFWTIFTCSLPFLWRYWPFFFFLQRWTHRIVKTRNCWVDRGELVITLPTS